MKNINLENYVILVGWLDISINFVKKKEKNSLFLSKSIYFWVS